MDDYSISNFSWENNICHTNGIFVPEKGCLEDDPFILAYSGALAVSFSDSTGVIILPTQTVHYYNLLDVEKSLKITIHLYCLIPNQKLASWCFQPIISPHRAENKKYLKPRPNDLMTPVQSVNFLLPPKKTLDSSFMPWFSSQLCWFKEKKTSLCELFLVHLPGILVKTFSL